MLVEFNRPKKFREDLSNIKKVFRSGQTGGNWIYTKKTEALLKNQIKGSKKILLTSSCTHSLEISAILLNFKPGEEIIVPSYTFVTSALAFHMHGAKIVFSDVNPKTLNIDPNNVEKLITEKTKAILVMHYSGVACEMTKILNIAKKYNLYVVEDNAHGLYGKYKNKFLGTIGDLSATSFHETKNFSCGIGGALIINNKKFIERAEIIREKGTNRSAFTKGLVKKYTWVDKGSSYLMPEVCAAILYNQIKNSKKILLKRKKIWNFYYKNLSSWAKINRVSLPYVPKKCNQTYHIFYLIFSNKFLKEKFAKYLKKNGINVSSHYPSLHKSKMGKIVSLKKNKYNVSNSIAEKILRLPLFYDLSNTKMKFVVNTLKKTRTQKF